MEMGEPGMTHGNMRGMPHGPPAKPDIARPVAAGSYYTCPMHPEIHAAAPGQCPKCGMIPG